MKKFISLLLVFSVVPNLFAQDDQIPKLSPASVKYREYREAISEPVYGLVKVKALVKKIKADKEENHRMPQAQYDALSFNEKFTYNMIHGEDATQNCDVMMGVVNEEKKIFAFTPSVFGGEVMWSERQQDFFKNNRAKVISLISSTILLRQRVGVNFKELVTDQNMVELIPDLIKVYNIKKKDHDILTVLMILMKEGNFPEFVKSQSYEKLYGENSNYKGSLDATQANQKLIINRAMAFYKTKVK